MLIRAIKESWTIALLMILLGFFGTFFMIDKVRWFTPVFFKVSAFTGLMWMLLWIGNAYTSEWVSTKISWTAEPVKRFWIGMVVMVVYTSAVVYFLVIFFRIVVDLNIGNASSMIYGSLIFTFVISTFMHSRGFLDSWRQAEIAAEKAKQESISAQYESLKNQVNPHFLFNSLNALTNLVYQDQDRAVKFIKQLSEVYRYVLDNRGNEVVPVEEELKFLESYLFLQQIRFGDKLKIEIDIHGLTGSVPPLALQMLIENAIKHNVISEEQPLQIKLWVDNGKIVVANRLQIKNILKENSSGVGLENIKNRYAIISDTPVEIVTAQDQFIVRLPILTEKI